MISDKNTLKDLTVLVTRPAQLADALCQLIEQAGGHAMAYPVLSIDPPADRNRLDALLAALGDYDIAVFISPSAVRMTLQQIRQLPAGLAVAAIGSSTQQHLEQQGVHVAITAAGHTSESLLQHPALQANHVSNKKVIIFRGEGGRTLLGDTLTERGARVAYAEVYRRARPQNAAPLSAAQLQQIDVITITSNEGLSSLVAMCDQPDTLTTKPLVVPGQRAAQLAHQLGFSSIVTAANATDQAMLQALAGWYSRTI